MVFFTIQKLGLILSMIGSFMAAFATGKPQGGGMVFGRTDKNGKVQHSSVIALNHPRRYRYGLILVAIGTLLQLF